MRENGGKWPHGVVVGDALADEGVLQLLVATGPAFPPILADLLPAPLDVVVAQLIELVDQIVPLRAAPVGVCDL